MDDDMYGEFWEVNNEDQRLMLIQFLKDNKDQPLTFKLIRSKRTPKQNNGIHAYCREVAKRLTAGGHDMKTILKEGVRIDPTMELVKEYMWTPVQKALTGKQKSSELDSKEVNTVYEAIAKLLVEKYDVNVQFGRR